MQLILKSANGLHINITGDDATALLKISQLCALLDVDYTGVRQRMFKYGESADRAIHYFLSKQQAGAE
ncbi:TPA: hypothetical protein ACXE8V_001625 [Pluralibacter gergoviae]